MAKEKKPDVILKEYWREKEHFADLYNAVLFAGRRVIIPSELEEMDADASHVIEHKGFVQSITAARDIVKVVKYSRQHGIGMALLGVENQDKIHYAMPLRVMEYDAYTYKRQYQENARQYRDRGKWKGLTEAEYLSGMRKTDRFIPVITMVVYYGEKEWDGARDLKDLLMIPEQMEEYVNNYHMNLVSVRENKFPFQNKHNRDFFYICSMLNNHSSSAAERKRQVVTYAREHQVDNEVIRAAVAATGKVIHNIEKEETGMWSFYEDLERESRERGWKDGQEIGLQIAAFCGQQGRISRTVRAILNGQPGISAGQEGLRPADQY